LTTPENTGVPVSVQLDSTPLVAVLVLVFGIAAFGTDMYQPAIPAIRRAFDTTATAVQWSLSIFLYGNALGHLIFGAWSDRCGRKPVLLLGLAAFAAASYGCAMASDITEFMVYRLAQGAAAASGPVLVRALINDCLTRDLAAQKLALLTGFMAFAAMLTPSVGGWMVQHQSWQWIFYALGSGSVLLLIAAAAIIPETLPRARRIETLKPTALTRSYLAIAGDLRFWCYAAPPALMFAGVFAYAAVNSFLLIGELGMAAQHHGIIYSVAACAFAAGSLMGRRLVQICGIDSTIVIGLTLGCVAAFIAVVASSLLPLSIALVVVPGLCVFFSTALVIPIALSTAVSLFPSVGGSASALVGFVQLVLAGLSSGIAAILYNATTLPLHLFTLGCCLGAAMIWIAGGRYRRATIREDFPNAIKINHEGH